MIAFCDIGSLRYVISVFFLIGAIQPWNAHCEEIDSPSLQATLLVFAGVEDPGWTIDDQSEIDAVRERLTGLPEAAEPNWPSLGFRGYFLEPKNVVLGFPASVRLYNGVVAVSNHGHVSYYQDEKDLEGLLYQYAERLGLAPFVNQGQ